MKLTLQIKLLPSDDQAHSLLETMKETNRACNAISEYAWNNKNWHQFGLHKSIYKHIRETFNLSAQIVVRAICKVADAYKKGKETLRTFRLLGAITYDCRILSYNLAKRLANLWTIDGRSKIPFVCHNEKLFPYIKGEADLVYNKGKFYLFQTVEVPEDEVKDIEAFIGVDFGIVNLATTSDGVIFSGKDVDRIRERTTRLKKTLQQAGSKSAKQHLKQISGKERRFKRVTNHTISKHIVQVAKDTRKGIAIENLSGFRATVRKEQRERFGKWSFDELGKFVEYKAKLAGVIFVKVNPRNTSRACSRCGFVSKSNRVSQSRFVCQNCGFSCNADFNGAINIALRAAANQPIVSGFSQGQALCFSGG